MTLRDSCNARRLYPSRRSESGRGDAFISGWGALTSTSSQGCMGAVSGVSIHPLLTETLRLHNNIHGLGCSVVGLGRIGVLWLLCCGLNPCVPVWQGCICLCGVLVFVCVCVCLMFVQRWKHPHIPLACRLQRLNPL